VDVLAVLAGTIEGYEAAIPSLRGKRRDECEDGLADLKEARAAVAELIEAVDELSRFSDETDWDDISTETGETTAVLWARVDDALTRVRGAA